MRYIVSFLLTIGTCSASGQGNMLYNFSNNVHWFNSYVAGAVADSNYFFVTGAYAADSISTNKAFAAKLDYAGHVLWLDTNTSAFGYSNYTTYNSCIAKLRHGRYVVAPFGIDTSVDIQGKLTLYQPYLYFFDSNDGNKRTAIHTDSTRWCFITCITVDGADNIIGAGEISSKQIHQGSNNGYYFDSIGIGLVKYDSIGNIEWRKNILMQENTAISGAGATANRITISADGLYYYIAGTIFDKQNSTTPDFYLKTDTAGNIIWLKYLPHITPEQANGPSYDIDIVSSATGGYFISDDVILADTIYQAYIYYGKFDTSGTILWSREFAKRAAPKADYIGTAIAMSKDGDLLLQGANGYELVEPVLLKTDTLGNVIWYREQEYSNQFELKQYLNTLCPTPDGRIITAGYIYSKYAHPFFDTAGALSWIVLTDSLGERYPGDTLLEPFLSVSPMPAIVNNLKLYPNPATNYLNIEHADGMHLLVQNVVGQVVYSIEINSPMQTLSLVELKSGVYLFVLTDKNGYRYKYKILKE